MEQTVAERGFSHEQHANHPQSWRNGAIDGRGVHLQDPSQSRDSRRWTGMDRNNMSSSSFRGEDTRENKGGASVCRDNIRGSCSRGSSCRFLHTDFVGYDEARFSRNDRRDFAPDVRPRSSQFFNENKNDGSGGRSLIGDIRSRSPCRRFQSGLCFRGSSCRYLHPEVTEFRKRSPCRNFQNGRCFRGSTCPHLHPEFSESERPVNDWNAEQHHGVVAGSRNYRIHEGNVDNNCRTTHVHDADIKENNSRFVSSREPRNRSPCRNFLHNRCQFGDSCRRWHPDNSQKHIWSADNTNNHGFVVGHNALSSQKHDEAHQRNNLRTEPPCQYIRRGSCYQGAPPANLHPGNVHDRTRYDFGAQHHQAVRATSRDMNFDRGNIRREFNRHGVRPYEDSQVGFNVNVNHKAWSNNGQMASNGETMNGASRGWSSERKRSRPDSDFGSDQLRPEVCLKFTKGRCDQGGNCKYLHSFHEYASSISQPSQKPHLETTSDLMSIDQANQCAETMLIQKHDTFRNDKTQSNENVTLWSPPFKRQRTWSSRPSFRPQDDNVRHRTLTHDYPLGNYHRSRPHYESQSQYPVSRSFKRDGPANRTNEENNLKVASNRLGEVMSQKTQKLVENSDEIENTVKTYSVEGTSLDHKTGMPVIMVSDDISTSVPKIDGMGDVLGNDYPVKEQENEVVITKVGSTMVDSSPVVTDSSLLVTDHSALPASQPSDAAILTSRRKLLVLDVNGLIADIVGDYPDRYKPDTIVGGKGVFKRPFCDDFLQFCFEKFDVGVWSSRTEKNVTRVLDCLMKNTRDKLLFCWHQSHCTQTGYKTVENNDKPLVLKELKKLWDKEEKDLPWKKGFYNETNTILLDDSPYKALRNPPYTAIFPVAYSFRMVDDKSLGPDGDLRLYLERLAEAENVQKFIQENPFGQRQITKTNLSWAFYSKIVGEYRCQEEATGNSAS